MRRSPRFGSRSCDSFALFRLAFATASPRRVNPRHMTLTRRLILQKARSHNLRRSYGLYAHGFRIYFTPLAGFFSPFPHGTSPLSVTREYLGLAGGSRQIHAEFLEFGITWDTSYELIAFRLRGVSPSMPDFPTSFIYAINFLTHLNERQSIPTGPTTPILQRLPAWHSIGLA